MDLGDLLKLIVPAIVVISLALNQVLGREEPKPARGPALGPRPGGLPPAPRPPGAAKGMPAPSSGPRALAPPEDVFVIRAEPTTSITRAAQARTATRRGGKAKAASRPDGAASKPAGLVQPNLGGLASVAPVTSAPMSHPVGGLGRPIGAEAAGFLGSPDRVREAIVASIVLGPPVALRGRRGGIV